MYMGVNVNTFINTIWFTISQAYITFFLRSDYNEGVTKQSVLNSVLNGFFFSINDNFQN